MRSAHRQNIDNTTIEDESKPEIVVTEEPSNVTTLVQTIGKPAELVDERRVLAAMAARNFSPYLAGFFLNSMQMLHCHWLHKAINNASHYYLGFGNLVGIADVEIFNLLQRAMVIDKPLLSIAALKDLGFEVTTDIVASLISGALYVAINQACGRDPEEFNPFEMAVEQTVFTGLVKGACQQVSARFGLGGAGLRLSLFGKSSSEVLQTVNVTTPRTNATSVLLEEHHAYQPLPRGM